MESGLRSRESLPFPAEPTLLIASRMRVRLRLPLINLVTGYMYLLLFNGHVEDICVVVLKKWVRSQFPKRERG
jgi:hypothetical protein